MVTTFLSLYIVKEARALGSPRHDILRMVGNVALDSVVGAVPIAGDVFDVMWRGNRRNMALLRGWLERATTLASLSERSVISVEVSCATTGSFKTLSLTGGFPTGGLGTAPMVR